MAKLIVNYPDGTPSKILDGDIDGAILVNGICTVFHPNGITKQTSYLRDRIIYGETIVYDKYGKECGRYTICDGIGTVKDWDENGILRVEMGIIGLNQHGLAVCYDANGKSIYRKWYLNGKLSTKNKFEAAHKAAANRSVKGS